MLSSARMQVLSESRAASAAHGLAATAGLRILMQGGNAIDADIRSACVPGTLGGWMAALDRFGSLDRATVFQPAIDLAEHGWPITAFGARMLAEQQNRLGRYPSSRATYFPEGRPP